MVAQRQAPNINFRQYNQQINNQYHDHGDKEEDNSFFSIILLAIIAIFFYYVGSFLIVFVRYDVAGNAIASSPNYEISWRLLFADFNQLISNIYQSFFGYFTAYAKLYNRDTTFLIPVDIGLKILTILYFVIYWVPWDTRRCYKQGFFDESYPYVNQDFKDSLGKKNSFKKSEEKITQQESIKNEETQEITQEPTKPLSLYPQYSQNLYLRAQRLKNQKPTVNNYNPKIETEEEDEEDEEPGILPFEGVHKPLEEIYQKNEKRIYDFIRRRILPGSNILLVSYFSTLFIVDLARPLSFVGYVLGVMSMFWCMQSFLMILDRLQFSHEVEDI